MKKITLTVYADPSHAWAKVSIDLLKTLDIQNDISRYSYKRGNFAYLEEDLDLTVLIDALKAAYPGIVIRYKEHLANKSSKIRSYVPYTQDNLMSFIRNHVQFVSIGD